MQKKNLEIPAEISAEILQKAQEESTIMRLAQQIQLPGNGLDIPVITGDPEPAWVGEGEKKPVSEGTAKTILMTAYKLAVIVPFSDEFRDDLSGLYNEMVRRVPATLGAKFDNTIMGGTTKPGDNFDTFADCTKLPITVDTAYTQLVTADANIADQNAALSGIAMSPKMKSVLLNAVDGNKRPLFINSVSENAIPQVLGVPVYQSRGIYVKGTSDAVVGVAGDWSQARYGIVSSMQMDISNQATLETSSGTINLWQQNMFALKIEARLGFRADTSCFNLFTIATA